MLHLTKLTPEFEFDIKETIYLDKKGEKLNIGSKKQLGEIVFEYMGISPLSRTEKGSPQFNDTMVDELVNMDVGWAKDLYNYNKLVKIKSSYIDRFLDGNENGYYYFSYKQHGTISGRYGSDAQQLPRPMEEGQQDEVVLKYSNLIRAFFISEDDRVFIDCDQESLEPKVFAHVANDPKLISIFEKGDDFYSTIAIDTEGLHEYSANKKSNVYLGKLNKLKRQDAKTYSLGIPYGMGGYALAKKLDIETQEGEQLVHKYLSAYPKLKKWMDQSKNNAHHLGYVSSEVGRKRHLPKVKILYKKYGDKLMNWKFRAFLKSKSSLSQEEINDLYKDYKNGVNNARNFQIQSMAASIINRSAVAITRQFKEENINGWCCAQVHDQLIFNVSKKDSDRAKKIVQDVMENNIKLRVKLFAPPSLSSNWRDGH